jgi:malate permease and related proteins
MNPNFTIIFLCLLLGIGLRQTGKFPKNAHQALNGFVIWISLPALVLLQIPQLLESTPINGDLLVPVSMPWILFVLSTLFFYVLGQKLKWKKELTGALILTAGLGNTSFVGFPILESLLGYEALRIGILVDQPGTFLVLSTLGIFVASMLSPKGAKEFRWASVIKNIFTFPPFLSLMAAILWWMALGEQVNSVTVVLERLSSTLVPLALVAVGFQLKLSGAVLKTKWKPLAIGLTFKLLLAPLFFLGLYVYVFGSLSFATRVTILESAMATMITGSVVAEEFGFDPEITSLMLGCGIPLSLFTVPLWNQLF